MDDTSSDGHSDDGISHNEWNGKFKYSDFDELKSITIDIRLLSQGRRKTTIIQGLSPELYTRKFLSYLNKTCHCTGSLSTVVPYGDVIKLTGDHRDVVKGILIQTNQVLERDIKMHGV